jgi:hypothetical protein
MNLLSHFADVWKKNAIVLWKKKYGKNSKVFYRFGKLLGKSYSWWIREVILGKKSKVFRSFWYENGRRVIKCSTQIDEVSDFTEHHSMDTDYLKHPLEVRWVTNCSLWIKFRWLIDGYSKNLDSGQWTIASLSTDRLSHAPGSFPTSHRVLCYEVNIVYLGWVDN